MSNIRIDKLPRKMKKYRQSYNRFYPVTNSQRRMSRRLKRFYYKCVRLEIESIRWPAI